MECAYTIPQEDHMMQCFIARLTPHHARPGRVVLDLGNLECIDHTTIAILLRLQSNLLRERKQLVLDNIPTGCVSRFQQLNAHHIFETTQNLSQPVRLKTLLAAITRLF